MDEMTMRQVLIDAKEKLAQQGSLLKRLTQTPLLYATVVSTGSEIKPPTSDFEEGSTVLHQRSGKQATVLNSHSYENEMLVQFENRDQAWHYRSELVPVEKKEDRHFVVVLVDNKLTEVEAHATIKVQPGDVVKLSSETMQIVGLGDIVPTGETVIVREVFDNGQLEIDYEGSTRVINPGNVGLVEKGDRIIIDASATLAMKNLGKSDSRYVVSHDTNVSWDDIGGLEAAKQSMIEAVELPFRQADLYRFYGKKPVKGILLYGPPGCGKTMLGKATATALGRLHGADSSEGFMYVKGPEILDKYVGVAESNIRQIFERARRFHAAHGYPAVVFIDEADAIMGKRGSGISSDIERTIVPMFLTEMDGLDESGAVVILATNRPDVLDPAVVRDGRIDRKVKVTRPTQASTAEIFELNLQNVPLDNGYTRQQLALEAAASMFDPAKSLYTINLKVGTSMDFPLSAVVNGGMVASVVDQATSVALQRDLAHGTTDGLRRGDLLAAVEHVFDQNRDLSHEDELAEFVEDFRGDITTVQRTRALTSN